ncbi:MAG: hypothetical protein GX458_02460 [Phyllobacteriaceae bacterium]|nr:hypothetical protein [Phyllobacteriaceae bacterium]
MTARGRIATLVLLCAPALFASSAVAAAPRPHLDRERLVIGDGQCRILPYAYAVVDETCASAGPMDVRIERAPKIGTLRLETVVLPFVADRPERAHCTGRTTPHLALIFQTSEGRYGRDRFDLLLTSPLGDRTRVRYDVTVTKAPANATAACRVGPDR